MFLFSFLEYKLFDAGSQFCFQLQMSEWHLRSCITHVGLRPLLSGPAGQQELYPILFSLFSFQVQRSFLIFFVWLNNIKYKLPLTVPNKGTPNLCIV